MWKSRWPSWAFRPNEPYGFCGRKATLNHAEALVMMKWCLLSSDVSWHIRDKLWPMPKHSSIILYVHGNQKVRKDGQPRMATSTLTQLLNYVLWWGTGRSLSLICQPTSEDMKLYIIKTFGYLDAAPRMGVDRCSLSTSIICHLGLDIWLNIRLVVTLISHCSRVLGNGRLHQ